ncbi:beta-galactosidase 17-like isoform X1 [Quercus suber]|uniref:beta-galactosidase 17-like isoform X1 n=1 Tax=Quercus suber TaxID=58331 RepID=UPI0032DED747
MVGNPTSNGVPLLYENGGPIIMVQIENEFGSNGNDKAYLHHLATLARGHLGDDTILYTINGGTREKLDRGTIREDNVFSAVDFPTASDPWPRFELQKEFNAPGKSPPLSALEKLVGSAPKGLQLRLFHLLLIRTLSIMYMLIIPTVLVNGSERIGTGWSSYNYYNPNRHNSKC